MKRCFFIFYFLFFISFFLTGQPVEYFNYYNHICIGDSLFQAKHYAQAGIAYQKAFNVKPGTYNDYYNAACYWSLAKNKEKAIEFLYKYVEKGGTDILHVLGDKDLDYLHETEEWKNFVSTFNEKINKLEVNYNKSLKKQLEEIAVKDQTLRRLYFLALDEFREEDAKMNYYTSLVVQEDSICRVQVANIIDNYGWVGIDEVGTKANLAIWLVIQHAPLEFQEKYLPLLKASVEKGNSKGVHLAYLEDRLLIKKGEKQIYGTQYNFNSETKESYFYPIQNEETVNLRRMKIGLEPIENYARISGVIYPKS